MVIIIGYSTTNSNGAYFKFEFSPSDFDNFFSSILPLSSIKHPCIADMLVTFTTLGHNVDRMVITTPCTGLNVHGLHLLSDVMEHRITIVPDEMIIVESNFTEGQYQMNNYMMLNQPDKDNAISTTYYTNGEVSGIVAKTDLILFGHLLPGIALNIDEESITFDTLNVNMIYKLELSDTMVFGKIIENDNGDLEVYITGKVNDPGFESELENFTKTLVEKEIQIYEDRRESLQSTKDHLQQLFYYYSDIVSQLQQDSNTFSAMYEEMKAKVDYLIHLQDVYQHDVDQLILDNVNELVLMLDVCDSRNCLADECVINRTCDVCEYSESFSQWLVGLVQEEDYEIVTYKKNIVEQDWTVDYFCRLITIIESWGKTAYGQTCSYKAGYDKSQSSRWVTENKNCNTSHFRSIPSMQDHSLIIDNLCLSNDSSDSSDNCGLFLQSSDCVVSTSACNEAQTKLLKHLSLEKQNQLNPVKELIQLRSDLSVAMTQAELYRYKRDSAKCKADLTHRILLSLHSQLSQVDDSYNAFLEDNKYIEEIKALVLMDSIDDLFLMKGISFDVIINENSTSSFPLLIKYEVNALNATNELLVQVDFKSSRSIIKRDIALASCV